MGKRSGALLCAAFQVYAGAASAQGIDTYARDSNQPLDQAYTTKIAQYTTRPDFNSPLTDYLPASSTVPTPEKVLGDVAGAPNMLPYAEDVYRYFRMLPRPRHGCGYSRSVAPRKAAR